VIAREFAPDKKTRNFLRWREEPGEESSVAPYFYIRKDALEAAGLSEAKRLVLIVGLPDEFES
jgi:hypothetical protein